MQIVPHALCGLHLGALGPSLTSFWKPRVLVACARSPVFEPWLLLVTSRKDARWHSEGWNATLRFRAGFLRVIAIAK